MSHIEQYIYFEPELIADNGLTDGGGAKEIPGRVGSVEWFMKGALSVYNRSYLDQLVVSRPENKMIITQAIEDLLTGARFLMGPKDATFVKYNEEVASRVRDLEILRLIFVEEQSMQQVALSRNVMELTINKRLDFVMTSIRQLLEGDALPGMLETESVDSLRKLAMQAVDDPKKVPAYLHMKEASNLRAKTFSTIQNVDDLPLQFFPIQRQPKALLMKSIINTVGEAIDQMGKIPRIGDAGKEQIIFVRDKLRSLIGSNPK